MNRIREVRKAKKLSQTELAEMLHVHQTAVSQWENGKRNLIWIIFAEMVKDASQDASQKPGIRPACSSFIISIHVCPSVIAISIQRPNQRRAAQGIEIAVVVDVIFCEYVIQTQTVDIDAEL